MGYQTTAGWSLLTSGLVTLLLKALPYDSLYWGILLLAVGTVVLLYRQTSTTPPYFAHPDGFARGGWGLSVNSASNPSG